MQDDEQIQIVHATICNIICRIYVIILLILKAKIFVLINLSYTPPILVDYGV